MEGPACVQLLLKDARVKVNEPDNDGYTPLYWAAYYGHLEVIKWWIASGREMDLGQPGNEKNDAIGVAKKRGKTEVVSLLERFKDNPEETRHEMRMELGWFDEMAAEIFALVVFLCDGLLEIKEENLLEQQGSSGWPRSCRWSSRWCSVIVWWDMPVRISWEKRELAFRSLVSKFHTF